MAPTFLAGTRLGLGRAGNVIEAPHTIPSDEIQLRAGWEARQVPGEPLHSSIKPPGRGAGAGPTRNRTGPWGTCTLVGESVQEHRG